MAILQIGNNGQMRIEQGIVSISSDVTFTTWSPTDKTAGLLLSNGNLTTRSNAGAFNSVRSVRNNLNSTTGAKIYWENTINLLPVANDIVIGIKNSTDVLGGNWNAGNFAVFRCNGAFFVGGGPAIVGGGASNPAVNDIVMCALDMSTQEMWFGINGSWFSGDPALGTSPSIDSINVATNFALFWSSDNEPGDSQSTANFGDTAFTYPVPSGFSGVSE